MQNIVRPDLNKQGYIFNIQQYSLHDGPGIRTIVFLKGCPLQCQWCSNPESQKFHPEVAFNPNKCIGISECGACVTSCAEGSIQKTPEGKIVIDRELCKECLQCAGSCPAQSLHVFGTLMSVGEVLKKVESDSAFYARSGGGMTVSGGEPLSQVDFTTTLLAAAKKRRINTAMETCGLAPWEDLASVSPYLDTVLYDIKCIDPVKHKNFTGCSNDQILQNFSKLCAEFPGLRKLVRTPLIPGFNDTEEEITAIADFIRDRSHGEIEYEILPYHRMGQAKYEYLNREYMLSGIVPSDLQLKAIQESAKKRLVGN